MDDVKSNELALGVFDSKALRKSLETLHLGDDYRIRTNDKVFELSDDIDIVQRIKIQRLH